MNKNLPLGYLKDILINDIRILKDEDYQKRVWFRGEGPEVSSYIDTTCHFLDRCKTLFKEPDFSEYLGNETYALLKKLYALVSEHLDLTEERINVDDLQEEELLNDPNWHDIQMLAGELEIKLIDFIKEHDLKIS